MIPNEIICPTCQLPMNRFDPYDEPMKKDHVSFQCRDDDNYIEYCNNKIIDFYLHYEIDKIKYSLDYLEERGLLLYRWHNTEPAQEMMRLPNPNPNVLDIDNNGTIVGVEKLIQRLLNLLAFS